MPCVTVVKADVYLANPLVAREGYTCDVCGFVGFELCIVLRSIDASGHPNRCQVIPAALLPVALVIRINHFNARNPLHMFHSIDAWDQQTRRITMLLWQCSAVHTRDN